MKAHEACALTRSRRYISYLDCVLLNVDKVIKERAEDGGYTYEINLHDFGYQWWKYDIVDKLRDVLVMRGYKVNLDLKRATLTLDWEDAL